MKTDSIDRGVGGRSVIGSASPESTSPTPKRVASKLSFHGAASPSTNRGFEGGASASSTSFRAFEGASNSTKTEVASLSSPNLHAKDVSNVGRRSAVTGSPTVGSRGVGNGGVGGSGGGSVDNGVVNTTGGSGNGAFISGSGNVRAGNGQSDPSRPLFATPSVSDDDDDEKISLFNSTEVIPKEKRRRRKKKNNNATLGVGDGTAAGSSALAGTTGVASIGGSASNLKKIDSTSSLAEKLNRIFSWQS